MAKVTMPQLGESVAEGTIGKWLKQPGDHVDKYEPLVEVVTDKVNAEVPSPFEGILREILVEEGATVPNNAEIAVIETADDATGASAHRPPGRRRLPRHLPPPKRTPTASPPDRPRHRPDPRGRRRAGRQRRTRTRRDGCRRVRVVCRRGIVGRAGRDRVRHSRAARDGRSGCPHDPGRAPPAARARPLAGADHGHRRRWPDHPRRRAQRRRGHAHGRHARGGTHLGRQRHPTGGGGGSAGTRWLAERAPVAGDPRLPGRCRRGPRPDDADAQGHRRADDTRPPGAARLRPDGGRRDSPHGRSRQGEGGLPGEGGDRAQLRAVRRQGGRRGSQAQPDLQRALDRAGPDGQAPDQHRRRRRGRRGPDRPGHPRRGHALDPRPQRRHRRRRRPSARSASSGSTISVAGRSPSTTPATSARTWSCRSSTCPRSGS